MRFGKSIYAIVTAAVVCGLLTAALASWPGSEDAEGPHAGGYLQQIPVVPVCLIALAVGVILLGWYWLRLAGVITSIAAVITDDKTSDVCPDKTSSALPTVSKTTLTGAAQRHRRYE